MLFRSGVKGCGQSFRHASELSLHRRTHPEYNLRKYRYLNRKYNKLNNEDVKGIYDSSKETNDEERNSKGELLLPKSIKINIANINVNIPMKLNDDINDLDLCFLQYMMKLSCREGNDRKTALPLPHMK